ncbi:MAG: hypothetical protein WCG99_03085 [Candidatus Berkelbacteria bacterium]
MSKSARAPLILVMLVSMVMAGYWQIFVPEKVSAATVVPPVTTSTFNPRFLDDAKTQVMVDGGISGSVNFTFTQDSSGKNKSQSDFISSSMDGGSSVIARLQGTLSLYKLSAMTGSSTLPTCNTQVTPGAYQTANVQPFYLVVSQFTPTSPRKAQGIATYDNNQKKYVLFNLGITSFAMCTMTSMTDPTAPLYPIYRLILLANNSFFSATIQPKTSIGDLTAYCNQMSADWESLKKSMRSILQPPPGAKTNPNWMTTTTTSATAVSWATAKYWYDNIFDHSNTSQVSTDLWNAARDTSIQFVLSPAGLSIFQSSWQTAQKVNDDIIALRAKYGDSVWPSGCKKLVKYKIDPALEVATATYANLGEFGTMFDKIMSNFKQFTDILQTPTTSAETSSDGSCGNFITNVTGGLTKILQGMLCVMGAGLHSIANFMMTKAFTWMEDALGVDAVHFTAPVTDQSVNNNSANSTPANTGTPTAGNPQTSASTVSFAPVTAGSSTVTATTCSPAPCFDSSWTWHGDTSATVETKGRVLCKQQLANPNITQADWDRGYCFSGVQNFNGYAFSVAPKGSTAGSDRCRSGGKFISFDSTCTNVLTRNDTIGSF